MKFSLSDHLWIIFCVLSLAVGQVLFKAVATQITTLAAAVRDCRLLGMTAIALCLYGAATVAWILVLRRVPLSYAYIFMALGFLLVPLAGHFFFREPLSNRYLLGVVLVASGLWVAISATSPAAGG